MFNSFFCNNIDLMLYDIVNYFIELKLFKSFYLNFNNFKMLKFKLIKLIVVNWLYKLIKYVNVVSKINIFILNFFNYLHC